MLYIIFILIVLLAIWVFIFYAAISFIRFVRDEVRCLQCRQRFFKQFDEK